MNIIYRFSIIAISMILSSSIMKAQYTVEEIYQLIEQNNTSLRAAADRTEASKQEAKVGTSLDDPEVGFDYLWGKPGTIGHRKDINVSQSFDIATIFGFRKRLANTKQELLDLELSQQRLELREEALDLLIQITYYNKALKLYNTRLERGKSMLNASEKRLQSGDASKLEVNRVRLSFAEFEAQASRFETEREILLLKLQTLCGGTEVNYTSEDYMELSIGTDITLRSLQEAKSSQQQLAAENELRATKSETMPSIKAGYMAELTDDEKWNGVTFGLSIPLWNNRHNVKRAKLQLQSAKSDAVDAAYQLEQASATQKLLVERNRQIAQKMQQNMAKTSSETLLAKALEEGEISLVEYTVEVSDLFDSQISMLEAERDYHDARLHLLILE